MKTECPHCDKIHTVPSDYTGRRVKCKKCGQVFAVQAFTIKPAPEGPPPSRSNFFTKIWALSPAPFRNAFLATLGVMTALVVGWYVIVWGGWLKRPRAVKIAPETSISLLTSKPKTSEVDFLAAAIRLYGKMTALNSLQQVRSTAATQYSKNRNIEDYFAVIHSLRTETNELYVATNKLHVPTAPLLQSTQIKVLDAIGAEYVFQDTILSYTDNTDDLSWFDDIEESGKRAVAVGEAATESVVQVLSKAQNGLIDAIVHIGKK